ncbi:MAG: restriction endonuclease subunit S [Anaerolineae bacterium]
MSKRDNRAISPGYKMTEVGVIPEDWDASAFGRFMTSAQNGFGRRPKSIENGPIVLRLADVAEGFIDLSNIRRIQMSTEEFGKHKIAKDDLLFIRVNGSRDYVGRCVHVKKDYDDVAYNDHLIRVRVSNEINSKYVEYLFNAHPVRTALLSSIPVAIGGQLTVNQAMLESTYIPLPPTLAEQRAIANALSEVDDQIAALDDLIAKKRDLKQGAMQRLLTGEERLPGFSGAWEVKRLGEIGLVGRGRVISHKEISRAIAPLYPVYSSQTQNDGIMGYLDTYDFEGQYITWTTDGVNAGKVFYRDGRFNCTNVCGTIKVHACHPQFIALVLDTQTDKYVSKNLANPKLMNNVMKEIEITIPTYLEEQKAIATVLSDMDAEISTLEAEREKIVALKQGMMQDLLTGKVRLV